MSQKIKASTNWDDKSDFIKDLKAGKDMIEKQTGVINKMQSTLNGWMLECRYKYYGKNPMFKYYSTVGTGKQFYQCIVNNKIVSKLTITIKHDV